MAMISEEEGRADEATETPDAARGEQAEAAAAAAAAPGGATAEMAAGGAAEEVAAEAVAAGATATIATAAGDAEPPPENTHVRDSPEAVKTAVVWLVVINILTVLSPLLRLSLKWALVVGLILTVSSFAIGGVAYLKAGRTP